METTRRMNEERHSASASPRSGPGRASLIPRVACAVTVAALLLPRGAQAVPSFARQTGMKCTVCHTAFPQLTPFGRWFKLNGYVYGDASKLPPVSAMLQGAPGYTITGKDQPGGAAPHFGGNDNWSVNQISGFYAGRLMGPYAKYVLPDAGADVVNHIGTFIQGTWDGVAQGAPSWDNAEIRYADSAELGGTKVDYGVYVNNNPTMSDLWNTTPVWGFPFSSSSLAPAPVAAPLIAGGVGQQVAGYGAYTMVADMVYAEFGIYQSLSPQFQSFMGVDPAGETQLKDAAPYWRLALYKQMGAANGEIGTYGLTSGTYPGRDRSVGWDRITDVGIDSQLQYLTDEHAITTLANVIYEWESWNASKPLGLADNANDHLVTTSLVLSYLFDSTYGFDVQYFYNVGSSDATLYGTRNGSPRTDGWTFQADWLPFNKNGGPWFWPYSNVKLDLQYTVYNNFDGSRNNFDGEGRNAPDNNTLYVEAWIAF
jgi:hypothetical protein